MGLPNHLLMDQYAERIAQLIVRQMENSLTAEEAVALQDWVNQSDERETLLRRLNEPEYIEEELNKFYKYEQDAGWEKIQSEIEHSRKQIPVKISKRIYALSAAIVTGFMAGALIWSLYFVSGKHRQSNNSENVVSDVQAPDVARALITLQDGRRIALDSVQPGLMALQAQTNVQKSEDGTIVYQPGESSDIGLSYNTLTNPRGSRMVKLTLSDGTKVWMNADSEIHYPVSFSKLHREVEVQGEVYFEVSPDQRRPFFVTTGQTSIEVKGTHFNVHAYKDEKEVQVTLLEGAVVVSNKGEMMGLVPNQQAVIADKIKLNKEPDIDAIMAWKEGLFNFKGSSIEAIMLELGRWYDVDFHLKDNIKESFYGDISRDNPLSKVLDMLQMTGSIHFKIEGNTIEITK